MPYSAPSRRRPTVFISYAHENDALRASVAALGEWLVGHGCSVLTDHSYVDRPPPEGWQAWMLGCIEQADTVLVVCTPKLKGRYEKTAAPDAGRGATYEGAIVTQRIYDDAMRNTKVFPVLPDGGTEEDIPTTLKSWWNGHRFPGGNEGIRRMVFAGYKGADPMDISVSDSVETGESPRLGGSHHERLTIEKLRADAAVPFVEALKREFPKKFPSAEVPKDAAAMVRWFSTRVGRDEIQKLFYLVRRALQALAPPSREDPERRAAEGAAVALFCHAATRLVDQADLPLANIGKPLKARQKL